MTNAQLLFEIKNKLWMSEVASREKWSFRSVTVAAGGRLPTQRACPDCFGFRGGPRGSDGIAAGVVSEVRLAYWSGQIMSVMFN